MLLSLCWFNRTLGATGAIDVQTNLFHGTRRTAPDFVDHGFRSAQPSVVLHSRLLLLGALEVIQVRRKRVFFFTLLL